ncbi:MAG: NAD-dependent malic enzyme [Thermomicrobiales bacterium]|nr:NAD-dependent malic enzyme [Thermomicrobiales bacterium]
MAEKTLRYVYEGRLERPRPSLRKNGDNAGHSFNDEAIDLRERHHGIIEIESKVPIRDHHILNMLYLPPAALAPSYAAREDPNQVFELTSKGNLVGIITDGSAVLGLGDIGPQAAMPVMEGKAALFRSLAGVEAFPICLAERDPDEIVKRAVAISPSLGGINLEDIAAPRCFEIEEKLKAALDMPVFHDDQHGTAIVVLAAMLNAAKLIRRDLSELSIVVNGAGSAGMAVTKLLAKSGVKDVILCDRTGAIYAGRKESMSRYKDEIAQTTNLQGKQGSIADVLVGADVFIGLSAPNTLTTEIRAHVQNLRPSRFTTRQPQRFVLMLSAFRGMASSLSPVARTLNEVTHRSAGAPDCPKTIRYADRDLIAGR